MGTSWIVSFMGWVRAAVARLGKRKEADARVAVAENSRQHGTLMARSRSGNMPRFRPGFRPAYVIASQTLGGTVRSSAWSPSESFWGGCIRHVPEQ